MRLTGAFLAVLQYFLESKSDAIWGLQVCKSTELPSGTVYPILNRLEEYGWIEGVWDQSDAKGPRRRFYTLTATGETEARRVLDRPGVRLSIRRSPKPAT